jgi:hypothetical protein
MIEQDEKSFEKVKGGTWAVIDADAKRIFDYKGESRSWS